MTNLHRDNIICSLLLLMSLITANSASANADEISERVQPCAACHERGNEAALDEEYAPSITGKPVEYLYQQLLNYQEGRRLNRVMNQMLAYLSSEYLHEIASYYAKQETIYKPTQSGIKPQSTEQTERARLLVQSTDGKQLGCIVCHGGDLRGNGVAIPSLRGLSANYISAQLGAWQTDSRHARQPDCMRDVANSLSGSDIAAVALWIANTNDSMLEPIPPLVPLPVPCGAVQ